MIRQAMQVRRELRRMQEDRQAAEDQRQREIEAAEREAAEMARDADETMPPPFMRRLAQLRQREVRREMSGKLRQSLPPRSHETGLGVSDGLGSGGDPGAGVLSSSVSAVRLSDGPKSAGSAAATAAA
jgi:hypothetical protein